MAEKLDEAQFQAYVDLLRMFLAQRRAIVAGIGDVLNAQRKPVAFVQDRALLSRLLEDCFYTRASVPVEQAALRGRGEQAHWAAGFRPRQVAGLFNELIHPAEMAIRGFYCWQQTRWPGRNARIRYAETLFNTYLLRQLEFLSLRLWDPSAVAANERLGQLQALLDELWRGSPADQPVLVRDACWLIPLAQSPTTDELAGYFNVAERVAESLAVPERVAIQQAAVKVLGGHLRSQIRHYCSNENLSVDDASVVRRTRTSNALDFALLIQGLSALIEAYRIAIDQDDAQTRFELAAAICQGISPDPEVFVNRVDLLGAYSMIEHLFVEANEAGQVGYTPKGERHLHLLEQYRTGIGQIAECLLADCAQLRPVKGACSPYGVISGNPSNLTELFAMKTLEPSEPLPFSLEDAYADGDATAAKLDWVNGWRRLPHIDARVQQLYAYPQQFAAEIFSRIEHALNRAASGGAGADATGRLYLVAESLSTDTKTATAAEVPLRYIRSSDPAIVAADRAEAEEQNRLLHERFEGHFLVSYQTQGGWVAVTKDLLTDVLAKGRDARLAGLPTEATKTLQLMCPGLGVVFSGTG